MHDSDGEPTRMSQRQGGDRGEKHKPMDHSVPRRSAFDRLLGKAEKPPKK